MRNRICLCLALLTLLLLPWASMAAAPNYSATVQVNSRSDTDRLYGFQEALSEVVNRVSGNNAMAHQLQIHSMKNLLPYVQRYYYQESTQENEQVDENGDSLDENVLHLVVAFDPLSVDNLIKTANVSTVATPTSNLTRVLLWLSINDKGKPWMLSNDDEDQLSQQVKFMGKTKGLELLLPMLDLDDVNALTPKEVEQFNIPAISQASVRYGSELVLTGSIVLDNKTWKTHWLLLKNGKRFSWDDQGSTMSSAILSGILKASEIINDKTAAEEEGNSDRIIVTVSGINSVTNYASVNAYFQNLNEVSSVQILRVEPTRVIFNIVLANSNKTAFMKAVQANHHFTLQSNPSPQEFNYLWK